MEGKRSQVFSKAGFFTLLGLLLAVLIIAVLYQVIVKVYLSRPALDEQTKELFPQQNISNPHYQSTLDRTRKTIQNFNKRTLQHEEEISK